MGGATSKNNDDLVDFLVNQGHIKCIDIERVFRLVDRGRFFPEEYKADAYKEQPFKVPDHHAARWSPGRLHISAPSMYAKVVEKLELRHGLTFLNIGSGTGWLNTVVGFLIGNNGINHGIEVHKNLVDFSNEKLAETLRCAEVSAFPFSAPIFVHGNALCQAFPESTLPRYDRIYCGAAASNMKDVHRLVKFLEIGGRLVVPVNHTLMCYIRTSEKRFLSQRIISCQFAELVSPAAGDDEHVLPDLVKPRSLQHLCRCAVRSYVRRSVREKCPLVMRSLCTDSSFVSSQNFTGPHIVYIHNPDAQGHVRVNVVPGEEHNVRGIRMFNNVARVRLVIPDAEQLHNLPFRLAEGDHDRVPEEFGNRANLFLEEVEHPDGDRLDVHELPDEEAEEEVVAQPPAPLPMRRNIFDISDDDEEEEEHDVLLRARAQLQREERPPREDPESSGDEEAQEAMLRERAERQMERHLRLHRADLDEAIGDEDVVILPRGPRDADANEGAGRQGQAIADRDQEAVAEEGPPFEDEGAEVVEDDYEMPPLESGSSSEDSSDNENILNMQLIRRVGVRNGREGRGPRLNVDHDMGDRAPEPFRRHRRRRHVPLPDAHYRLPEVEITDTEGGSSSSGANGSDGGNKRRRVEAEPEESKSEKAYRLQHESIAKFGEEFVERIDSLQPMPVPLSRYLKFGY